MPKCKSIKFLGAATKETGLPRAIVGIFVAALLMLSGCQSKRIATASAAPITPAAFDENRAFDMLSAQCAFGPRVPNSDAHEQCKDYIIKNLTPYVDKVETQSFGFRDRDRNVRLSLTNIIGVINPTAPHKIMLLTHWDSRPTADQEIDEANRLKPIPGADDGASGTAVLLELARTFHDKRPTWGVVLLFVDGEDWGPNDNHMYLGARHFAVNQAYQPDFAILLDMIGQKDLQIHREQTSEKLAPEIDNKVWNAADELGYSSEFPNDTKYEIGDDHDCLNAAGIPTVDLIDFDFPYWHTLADTPDKCSPDSLRIVGQVVAQVVYSQK